MVDFGYVQIIRLLDLIEAKLDELEEAKIKDFQKPLLPIYEKMNEENTQEEAPKTSKYDKDIAVYQSMKDKIYGELNKLNFRFGLGEEKK